MSIDFLRTPKRRKLDSVTSPGNYATTPPSVSTTKPRTAPKSQRENDSTLVTRMIDVAVPVLGNGNYTDKTSVGVSAKATITLPSSNTRVTYGLAFGKHEIYTSSPETKAGRRSQVSSPDELSDFCLQQVEKTSQGGAVVAHETATNPLDKLSRNVEDDQASNGTGVHSSRRQRRRPRRYSAELAAVPSRQLASPAMMGEEKDKSSNTQNLSADLQNQEAAIPQTTPRKRGRPRKHPRQEDPGNPPNLHDLENPFSPKSKQNRVHTPSKDVSQLEYVTTANIPRLRRVNDLQSLVSGKAEQSGSFAISQSARAFAQCNSPGSLEKVIKTLRDPELQHEFELFRNMVLERITGRSRVPLLYAEDECLKVRSIIQNTVEAGEGNSMLIIGPRDSGKTLLINQAIDDVAAKHRNDFHVIRLNGFLHTDDRAALKEIWRQLGQEMDAVENRQSVSNNYSEIFASLLALLSHTGEHDDLESHPTAASKSVIFIIDEFDLFVTHPRQTLLYNLFDIAQSRKAPIAVLGVTTRIDVTDSLEKRVKSRFSHRSVYVPLPRSLSQFREICHSILVPDLQHDRTGWCAQSDAAGGNGGLCINPRLLSAWRIYISWLLREDGAVVVRLQHAFFRQKSVSSFTKLWLGPISNTPSDRLDFGRDLVHVEADSPDSKLQVLSSLTELQLCLLIATARLDIILDTDTCNFNMAYDEYAGLVERFKLQNGSSGATASGVASRAWSREAALGAWESLEQLSLLVPWTGFGAASMNDGNKAGKLYKIDVSLEEIGESEVAMSNVLLRWCHAI